MHGNIVSFHRTHRNRWNFRILGIRWASGEVQMVSGMGALDTSYPTWVKTSNLHLSRYALPTCTHTILIAVQYWLLYQLILAMTRSYEHTVTQHKYSTDEIYLNIVVRNIIKLLKKYLQFCMVDCESSHNYRSLATGHLICKIWLKRYCKVVRNITWIIQSLVWLILPFLYLLLLNGHEVYWLGLYDHKSIFIQIKALFLVLEDCRVNILKVTKRDRIVEVDTRNKKITSKLSSKKKNMPAGRWQVKKVPPPPSTLMTQVNSDHIILLDSCSEDEMTILSKCKFSTEKGHCMLNIWTMVLHLTACETSAKCSFFSNGQCIERTHLLYNLNQNHCEFTAC